MVRLLVLATLLAACSGSGDDDSGPGPDPTDTPAAELYGLKVGARWTYLRAPNELRWKEITACEQVLLIDGDTGERRTVTAYVRENRGIFGITSVHYLVADGSGVLRIRRDDVDKGGLVTFTTYEPYSPRILNGPYITGDDREFALATSEFNARDETFRGTSDTSAVDLVLGERELVVVAGTFRTVGIERQWAANNAHNVRSFYASGVGEVLEETIWPTRDLPRIQIEELVAYTPGYGSCEVFDGEATTDCREPLDVCNNTWGTGRRGCADLRVDPANCGSCGTTCPSGVCAGGECQVSDCAMECEGSTICCPLAWNWGIPGCTSPARDRWNCGGCGNACGLGLVCVHGECSCPPGSADCGEGFCRSFLADAENCGECGHECGGDTPNCVKGICVGTCLSVDLEECDDECVDLAWHNDHCGSCGKQCGAGDGTDHCRYGECVTCEEAGKANCGGDCTNLEWSDKNCGACGNSCPDQEACVFGECIGGDGTCATPCISEDDICCSGACVNPRRSDNHCGGCGVAMCEIGCREACRDGACVAVDCGGGDD